MNFSQDFLSELPKHACALELEHNEHRLEYKTAEEQIKFWEFCKCVPNWKDEEDKQECIRTNEIWTLCWYDVSPVGFYYIAASTLDKLLAFSKEAT